MIAVKGNSGATFLVQSEEEAERLRQRFAHVAHINARMQAIRAFTPAEREEAAVGCVILGHEGPSEFIFQPQCYWCGAEFRAARQERQS